METPARNGVRPSVRLPPRPEVGRQFVEAGSYRALTSARKRIAQASTTDGGRAGEEQAGRVAEILTRLTGRSSCRSPPARTAGRATIWFPEWRSPPLAVRARMVAGRLRATRAALSSTSAATIASTEAQNAVSRLFARAFISAGS